MAVDKLQMNPKALLEKYYNEAPEAADIYKGIVNQFGEADAARVLTKYGQPADYQQLVARMGFGDLSQEAVGRQLQAGVDIPTILQDNRNLLSPFKNSPRSRSRAVLGLLAVCYCHRSCYRLS